MQTHEANIKIARFMGLRFHKTGWVDQYHIDDINEWYSEWGTFQKEVSKETLPYSEVACKAFAAFVLQKSGWKKWPEEQPEEDGWYNLMFEDGHIEARKCSFKEHDWKFFWNRKAIIALMPIQPFDPQLLENEKP